MMRWSVVLALLGSAALSAQVFQSADCNTVSGVTPYSTSIDIYDGSLLLGSAPVTPGSGAFSFALPPSVRDTITHVISARAGTNDLTGSPKSINCGGATPAYQYIYTESFEPFGAASWTQNGTSQINSAGFGSTDARGATLIYQGAGLSGSPQYELNSVINLRYNNSADSTYTHYVRASPDAWDDGVNGQGSFAATELSNIVFDSNGNCSAALNFWERLNGTLSWKGYAPVGCSRTIQMRTVVWDQNGVSYIWTMINGLVYGFATNLTTGQPGFGARHAANLFTSTSIGPRSLVPPAPIDPSTIATSVAPTAVDFRWQDPQDNTGVGIVQHELLRNNQLWDQSFIGTDRTDANQVTAATSYSYGLLAISFHGIWGNTTTFNVTTPPAGSIDPRQVGVRPTGAYYGAYGEQIDVRSGNLNYSLPLLTAKGRAGTSVPLALTYNSQNWRLDQQQSPGTHWKLGADVGYGFGWKLQIGSITPFWNAGWWGHVDHYLFTDATGAEYRLGVNAGGVWSSQESAYVWFDANTNILHFRDGTFWAMGCTSGGQEPDAGTMYPTVLEDTNGNQILVRYGAGLGTSWANSSARIAEIDDVLAVLPASGPRHSYGFTYNMDSTGFSHLTSINNYVIPTQSWNFTMQTATLISPFTPATTEVFGPTSILTGATQNIPATATSAAATVGYSFAYDSAGAVELQQVTMPQGGYLRWTYGSPGYTGNRVLREVSGRHVSADGTSNGELHYTLQMFNSASDTTNSTAVLYEPSGGAKVWNFFALSFGAPTWEIGLTQQYQERITPGQTSPMPRWDWYTWAQNSSGNPYVSVLSTTLDYNVVGAQVTATTNTTVDQYGNITRKQVTDYDGSTQWVYASTYLGGTNYVNKYILNRLLTATVTKGATTFTLATNTYDGSACANTPAYNCPDASMYEHDPSYGPSLQFRGNVTTSVSPGKTANMIYDVTGTVVSVTDASGQVALPTSIATNFTLPDRMIPNPDGSGNSTLQTSLGYNGFLGTTSVTSPNNAISNVSYDSFGRVQTTAPPVGAAATAYWYTYSPISAGGWTVSATTNGHWTKTTLDGFGRTIQTDVGFGGANPYQGSGGTVVSSAKSVFDKCACSPVGAIFKQSRPFGPSDVPANTTYTYDSRGRAQSVTQADGISATTYSYSGNRTTVTDAKGNWKTYTKDAMANLLLVSEPDPDNPGQSVSTNYTYDAANHLTNSSMTRLAWTAATGPGSTVVQNRVFNYDPNTFYLTSEVHPESGTTNYTYNSDGTLATRMNGTDLSTKVTYHYAGFGRFAGTDASVPEDVIYDANTIDASYGQNLIGRVAQRTSGSCGNVVAGWVCYELYSYDVSGNMTGKRDIVKDALGNWVTDVPFAFSYDAEGRMQQVTYAPANLPGNASNTYTISRDNLGRATGMVDGAAKAWASGGTYNAAGQLTALTYGSGNEVRLYDVAGQLTDIQLPQASPPVNLHYQFGSPSNGQLASVTDSTAGEQTVYAYDPLKRVKSATVSTLPQIVQNAGFETAGMGWAGSFTQSTYAHSGSYSGSLLSSSSFSQSITQYVTLRSGQDFIVSAWVATNANGLLSIQLTADDGAYGNVQTAQVNPSGAWQKITVNYTGTATGRMRISLTVLHDAGTHYLGYFDDVQIDPGPPMLSMNYAYDGFGNLTSKGATNGQYSTSLIVEGKTNRVVSAGGVSFGYTANGSAQPAGVNPGTFTYDTLNRLIHTNNSGNQFGFGYMPGTNSRVIHGYPSGGVTDTMLDFYGPDGRLLTTYHIIPGSPPQEDSRFLYLDGKPLSWTEDRIGSRGNYLPYGDYSSTSPAYGPYATYFGDAGTGSGGLFAMQRYYNSNWGRFLTVDPLGSSAKLAMPQSWNRYGYVLGDPVNANDPTGQYPCGSTLAYGPDGVISTTVYDCPDLLPFNVPLRGRSYGVLTIQDWEDVHPAPCPPIPEAPSNADIDENVQDAVKFLETLSRLPLGPIEVANAKTAYLLAHFNTGASEDYKQYGDQYREFGNFNYGAVAYALGLPPTAILGGAGLASALSYLKHGTLPPSSWGNIFTGPPYGDNPGEQNEIRRGIGYEYSLHRRSCSS